MIQLEGVSKVYRTDRIETLALDSVDVSVEEGEFVSVMGPSDRSDVRQERRRTR